MIVADGTSCRHQIHDGARREAVHVARVLQARAGVKRAGGEVEEAIGEEKNRPPIAGRLLAALVILTAVLDRNPRRQ